MPASSAFRSIAIAVMPVAAACASAHADFTFRTVAISGSQAPDRPLGQRFGSFNPPRINTEGQVAFEANLLDAPTMERRGGWSERPEGLRLTFHEGQSIPSLGADYKLALPYGLTPVSGVTHEAFFGLIGGGLLGGYAMVASHGGEIRPLAVQGQQIPGTSLVVPELNASSVPVITPAGEAAFRAYGAILTNRNGTLSCVAHNGSPVPGMDGWTFIGFQSEPVINGNGTTAFTAQARTGSTGVSAIWREDGGTPQMVVNSNMPVPGRPGALFGTIGYPTINNAGQIAFANFDTNWSIWRENGGEFSMVARTGEQAPDAPEGVKFAIFRDHLISGSGGVGLHGKLSGPGVTSMNDEGVWSDSTGELRLVAREGQQAPGMPEGVVFGTTYGEWLPWGAMNVLGQYAFSSSCTGPGMPSGADAGIWFTDLEGLLHYLIGVGDTLSVAPGDSRTISRVATYGFSGGEDGRGSFFNARSELTFLACFTDGSQGVFVAAIPEPAGAVLLLTGWLLLLRRRAE
ncbi:MAG: hypothetical protein QUV05_15405 [Phycisphaerae bacterium]|nr:hypothetical protein [Phycisphaerae bacterium]